MAEQYQRKQVRIPGSSAEVAADSSRKASLPAKSPDALRRLARYLLPLWPKLSVALLCLIAVSLFSLYNGKLAKNLLDAMKDAAVDRTQSWSNWTTMARWWCGCSWRKGSSPSARCT